MQCVCAYAEKQSKHFPCEKICVYACVLLFALTFRRLKVGDGKGNFKIVFPLRLVLMWHLRRSDGQSFLFISGMGQRYDENIAQVWGAIKWSLNAITAFFFIAICWMTWRRKNTVYYHVCTCVICSLMLSLTHSLMLFLLNFVYIFKKQRNEKKLLSHFQAASLDLLSLRFVVVTPLACCTKHWELLRFCVSVINISRYNITFTTSTSSFHSIGTWN